MFFPSSWVEKDMWQIVHAIVCPCEKDMWQSVHAIVCPCEKDMWQSVFRQQQFFVHTVVFTDSIL